MLISIISHSSFNSPHLNAHFNKRAISHPIPLLNKPTLFTRNSNNHPFISITKCTNANISSISLPIVSNVGNDDETVIYQKPQDTKETEKKKSFWGAVSLIIGTAIGPGMLGLPAATLSHGLASKAFGSYFGAFVALVYASLSFSLLVACVSGIGSIVSQVFPWMNHLLAHALFPVAVGIVIGFFPFKAIDVTNRLLCFIMFFSITSLVTIGLSVARRNVLGSFAYASWNLSSMLSAIPVTVLTLGFHVITPFICKIAGNNVADARKAVLVGGIVPLIMVLSWNFIVLGLAGTNATVSSRDPISLLLSVNPSALSAVQFFAFSALATSFIGYTVSLPKQLVDTLELIFGKGKPEEHNHSESQMVSDGDGTEKVGFVTYSAKSDLGNMGKVSFTGSRATGVLEAKSISRLDGFNVFKIIVLPLLLGLPVLIASFFPSTFSRALDFAGVYANCFLFGMLPPAMAYIKQSRTNLRLSILPGGNGTLMLLFGIAVILGIWH